MSGLQKLFDRFKGLFKTKQEIPYPFERIILNERKDDDIEECFRQIRELWKLDGKNSNQKPESDTPGET